MEKHITAPITKETAKSLHAGDYVYVTGTIYTARDAAHKRMDEALDRGEELPIDIKNQAIYYMGPSPAREGRPIGNRCCCAQWVCISCGNRRSWCLIVQMYKIIRGCCI